MNKFTVTSKPGADFLTQTSDDVFSFSTYDKGSENVLSLVVEDDEPMFGTHIREVIQAIKSLWSEHVQRKS